MFAPLDGTGAPKQSLQGKSLSETSQRTILPLLQNEALFVTDPESLFGQQLLLDK